MPEGCENFVVKMPISSPCVLNNGPPLFSRIDRSIDLKDALHPLRSHGRNPPASHRDLPQTEWKPNGHYFLIQPDPAGMTEGCFREPHRFDFEQRQIVFGIGADYDRRSAIFSRGHHDDPAGVGHHVMGRKYVAVGMDDDPASGRPFGRNR